MKSADKNCSKLVFSYNTFLADFLKLAKTISPDVSAKIKANYRTIEKMDTSHIAFGSENIPLDRVAAGILSRDASSSDSSSLDKKQLVGVIVKDVSLHDVLSCADADTRLKMVQNVYLLSSLVQWYNLHRGVLVLADCGKCDDDDDDIVDVFEEEEKSNPEALLKVIQSIMQRRSANNARIQQDISKITSDDLLTKLLTGLYDAVNEQEKQEMPQSMLDALANLEKSKIGSLIHEVAQELDQNSFDTSNPAEWLNFANISNPNSFLSSAIGKFGSKLTSKMQSGEIKQEELLTDALSLVKNMGIPESMGGAGEGGGTASSGLGGLGGFDLSSIDFRALAAGLGSAMNNNAGAGAADNVPQNNKNQSKHQRKPK
jgi:hypothetical protein